MRRQLGKGCESDVLCSRHNPPETFNVSVEMLVVDQVDELAPEDTIHVLKVGDHPCLRIDCAGNGHLDHVVVAVIAGAGTEDLLVASLAPFRTTEDVRRGEGRPACNPNGGGTHRANSSGTTPAPVKPLAGDVTESRRAKSSI